MKKKRVKKASAQLKHTSVRKKFSQVIIWLGIIMIGLLAVPTGVLIAMISAIWSITDKIALWVGDGKRKQ